MATVSEVLQELFAVVERPVVRQEEESSGFRQETEEAAGGSAAASGQTGEKRVH